MTSSNELWTKEMSVSFLKEIVEDKTRDAKDRIACAFELNKLYGICPSVNVIDISLIEE